MAKTAVTGTARRALLSLTAYSAVACLSGLGSAAAAPAPSATAQITEVQASGQHLQFVLTISGSTDAGTVDPASIRVSIAGQSLTAHATTSPEAASTGSAPSLGAPSTVREAMLVLDASGSMQGSRLAAAKTAAWSYVQALPSDVKVGLVAFADRARLVVRPTADRVSVHAALADLSAGGNTALYDAIVVADAAFDDRKHAEQRRMLIISDGADTSSAHRIGAVTSLLSGSGTGVDAVGIGLTAPQAAVLKQITAAGSGQVLPTSGLDQLRSAFVQAARTFRQQVRVAADIPPGLAGQRVTLTATLSVGGMVLTATSGGQQLPITTAIPVSAAKPTTASRLAGTATTANPPMLLFVLIFVGLFAVGMLLLAKPKPAQDGRARLDQVDAYRWSEPIVAAGPVAPVEGQMATVALSVVDRLIRATKSRSRIAADLERAGMRIRPQEWILLRISAGIAMIAALSVLTRSLPIGLLLGSLLGWLGTRILLKVKAGRRCSAFADQLPDVLQLIASSLRSGFSLPQALDGVVRERTQPAAGELARALTESRLGVELELALDGVAERMKSQDLTWVVMAIRISRDVGGNLAEVLLTTVHTMRERAQLKRQIRALSAEGRLSAYILIALPVFVAGWFTLVRPQYLRPLYTVPAGVVMLVVAVVGLLVGSWWMTRIVKVEV